VLTVEIAPQGTCMTCHAPTLRVLDLQGRELLRQGLTTQKTQVFVGDLVKGLYIWELFWDNKKVYGKIIIE
jgi:hypothetical protein